MRIGMIIGSNQGLDDLVEQARACEAGGLHSVWLSHIFSFDALAAIAVIGREVPRIELGTAVVPIYGRHPVALAQLALTAQAACGGRLALGIGLSHQVVVETMWGLPFTKTAQHMGEYLSVLVPLVQEGRGSFQGEVFRVAANLAVPGASSFPVLVAALGPRMLRLAGEKADGTVTWMTGPATIASHVAPSIVKAAEEAGRAAPRVGVGLPICVTTDIDGARERAARDFAIYGSLPSYRAMLDREGAAGPADVALVGDEESVRAQVAALAEAGATDFMASPFGSDQEQVVTRSLLADLA